ncbi:MAG: nucleoside 2-deoxyribosyltransferase [bacterium]|nr:nucleoside 2-deoxyribosyltransferase [bacterium]
MAPTFQIYFAGALFSHKDLSGNLRLAAAMEEHSRGRFRVFLPQQISHQSLNPQAIRDADFEALLGADLALFNFDGAELDSGTVAEFMAAKFVDLPAVQLRTDFRAAGDQGQGGDPWNLMCSFYPRSRPLWLPVGTWMGQSDLDSAYQNLARQINQAFEELLAEPSIFGGDQAQANRGYQQAVKSLGGMLPNRLTPDRLEALLKVKASKGLL